MASLGIVLEGYPDAVIIYVTDPKTGVQRKTKWPPTISEIVEACDEHHSFLQRCEKAKTWGKRPPMIEGPREDRPTLEELKAKYGPNWGLDLDAGKKVHTGFFDRKIPSWDDIAETYSADPSLIARLTSPDNGEG